MVIASHVVFSCHGFWLPNNARGSWSTEVWAEHLKPFGPATKTTARVSLANRSHDHEKRLAARAAMIYPAVRLNGAQRDCVARGFETIIAILRLDVYACAILHDHVHLVTARHNKDVEELVGFLKRAATRQLTRDGLHPLARYINRGGRVPSPWVDGGWKRFIDRAQDIPDAIEYVNENPERVGLTRQNWRFVAPFHGCRRRVAATASR